MRKALALLVLLAAAPGCVDIVAGIDGTSKYIERDEKSFTMTGKPDVVLSTFDGSIEIRPWEKADVQVVVEKRGRDKQDVSAIDVQVQQTGNRIEVTVTEPKRYGFDLHFSNRSAKLILSVPASADVFAKSGDGSIDIERVTGRLQLRSGDGSIRGRQLGGDVAAHTGDGSIKLDGVEGALSVDTGDGSIVLSGKLSGVRARTGDGSVTIHANPGSAPNSDWDIVTGDGSVTLEVPEDFGAELDAHTGDGSIRNELGLKAEAERENDRDRDRDRDRRSLKGTLGAGGKILKIRTGDGSIRLKTS